MMKIAFAWISVLVVSALFLGGCRPQETDVTRSHRYHFSSFTGTIWRTKVKLPFGDVKEYTGVWHPYLLTPAQFDPKSARYIAPADCRVMGTAPAGTRIRIERLIFDTGEGSLLWVTASLDEGTYPKRIVYLDDLLLRRNTFLHDGASRIWGVNPKYLERDGPARKVKGGGK